MSWAGELDLRILNVLLIGFGFFHVNNLIQALSSGTVGSEDVIHLFGAFLGFSIDVALLAVEVVTLKMEIQALRG